MLAIIALERHGLPAGGEVFGHRGDGGRRRHRDRAACPISAIKVGGVDRRRDEFKVYLEGLGASEVIHRFGLGDAAQRPLDREAVGRRGRCGRRHDPGDDAGRSSNTARVRGLRAGGWQRAADDGDSVPCCVAFNLLGIDSVMCPKEPRLEAWRRLTRDLSLEKARPDDRRKSRCRRLAGLAPRILGGQIRGRHRDRTYTLTGARACSVSGPGRNCPNLWISKPRIGAEEHAMALVFLKDSPTITAAEWQARVDLAAAHRRRRHARAQRGVSSTT